MVGLPYVDISYGRNAMGGAREMGASAPRPPTGEGYWTGLQDGIGRKFSIMISLRPHTAQDSVALLGQVRWVLPHSVAPQT